MRFRSRMAAPRFADAVAKYDAARIALFGVPYDRTCSFRGGSRFAPRAIREAPYNFETFMMDHQRDLLEVPVADLGDTPAFGRTTELGAGDPNVASDVVGARKIRVVLDGEHRHGAARVQAAGAHRALKEVDRDRIYLPVDMDGIGPSYAPAVGNPEPFGLAPLQVKKLIGILAPHLVGMDLNEVSPAWDFGQTALLAARLIREAIVAIDEARG